MSDRPYRGVDPLLGTPLRMPENKPKGDLRERLAHEHERRVDGGTMRTLPDGSMQFVPGRKTPLQGIAEPQQAPAAAAFVPGTLVRVTACIDALLQQDPWPISREFASWITDQIGMVDGPSEDQAGMYVMVGGNRVLLLPQNLRALTPAELRAVLPPVESASVPPALTHNQQVLQYMRAVQCEVTPDMLAKRAAEESRAPLVEFKHMPAQAELGALSINEAQAMFYKDLLLSNEETAEVLHPYTCDLKPNDWVEVIDGTFAGMQGSVRHTHYGEPLINVPGGNTIKTRRCNVRLVTRAQG